MTLLKKKVKQVSLDFKALSADTVSRIEMLDKEASLQSENQGGDEDCQIISIDSRSEDERSNQKIDRFFRSISSAEKLLKSCDVSLQRCDAKIMTKSDSDSSEEEEFHEISSSDESEKNEEPDSETENFTEAAKTTVNEAPKSPSEKKKRRTSAMVQAERKRKELDKARRRIEREAARLKRMEELAKAKEEKRKEKEKQAAEREAQKQQIEKEKEEKRIKREEAKRERDRLKEEERLKKEDEKQKREEGRRKKEEEKIEKLEKLEHAKKEKEEAKKQEAEELQRKAEKQAMFFNSFFIKDLPKPTVENKVKETEKTSNERKFGEFHVKKGMRLAPRRQSSEASARAAKLLDTYLCGDASNEKENLYLSELRSGRRKGMTAEATWPFLKSAGEIQCLGTSFEVELANLKWFRAKLLQFCENTRPPFYGTFRQRSHVINGRTPFHKDKKLFDYDIDSDEEWEEDPGESLSHSENEDEDEEDQDEENDGFFVPHGYLSEDEGADDDEDRLTPEMRKAQQQLSAARFEASMKKRLQPLVNVIVQPSVEPSQHSLLSSFKIIEMTNDFPIAVSVAFQSASANRASTKNGVPDEATSDLIRLVHGNKLRMKKILFEFRMFWEFKMNNRLPAVTYEEDLKGRDWKEFSISKTQLEKRIREIAKFEDGSWRVGADTLAVHPTEEVNGWKYVTNVLEIRRKKRASSPPKPNPQKSPNKEDVDKQKQTLPDKNQKRKMGVQTEGNCEIPKSSSPASKLKKGLKVKLLKEQRKDVELGGSKSSTLNFPNSSEENGKVEELNEKLPPKSAKKTAQREAMQRLKADLLKETTKLFKETADKSQEHRSVTHAPEKPVAVAQKNQKSPKTIAKKPSNISASSCKSQKITVNSASVSAENPKTKPERLKTAKKNPPKDVKENTVAEVTGKPVPTKTSNQKRPEKSELKKTGKTNEKTVQNRISGDNSQTKSKPNKGPEMQASVKVPKDSKEVVKSVACKANTNQAEIKTVTGETSTKHPSVNQEKSLSAQHLKSKKNDAKIKDIPESKSEIKNDRKFTALHSKSSDAGNAHELVALKENHPEPNVIKKRFSVVKLTNEVKKTGEIQKTAKNPIMNGRPLKRLSDITSLTKNPARKPRLIEKEKTDDEVEIIDLCDS